MNATAGLLRDNLNWKVSGQSDAVCPACGDTRPKLKLLETRSLIGAREMLAFVTCPTCRSRFVPDYASPDYSVDWLSNYARAFYVEQGAGVDILARPAFALAARGEVNRYLEVGCGYGFGVDIAHRVFGWDSMGIDPSGIALQGGQDLGIRIDSVHLGPDTAKDVGQFDAIVAMEVIEHISDAVGFLEVLRAHLTPGGAVYMSTPNARVLDNPEHPHLVAVLSSGFHVTLFSREGLATVMRRAGFNNVEVVENDSGLFAAGTLGGEPVRVHQDIDRARYAEYLRGRLPLHKPGSTLWTGFAYRLYKEMVNHGDYAAASQLFEEIAGSLREARGIDLDNPRQLLAEGNDARAHLESGRWPFCLAGLLYLRGINLINTDWAPEPALPYFLATIDIGNLIRASLLRIGADDGELQAQLAEAAKAMTLCTDRLKQH